MASADEWMLANLGLNLAEFGTQLGRDTGCNSVSVSGVALGETLRRISFEIVGKTGSQITWSRKLSVIPENGKVISERIAVDANRLRTGIGRTLTRNLRDVIVPAGIKKLEARATTPAGSYFCARCGFLPSEVEWPALRTRLLKACDALRGNRGADRDEIDAVMKVLQSSPPEGVRALLLATKSLIVDSDTGHNVTIARAALTRVGISWSGVLDFGIQSSADWFSDYVGDRNG